jgi:hypothetical protein
MDVRKIIAEIDAEIASLQHARVVLLQINEDATDTAPRRGRPRGPAKAAKSTEKKTLVKPSKQKRTLSAEGRKAIADAMKKRWAERRKQAPAPAKKAVAVKKQPPAAAAK